MNNYSQIATQWSKGDKQKYPNLFGLVEDMMTAGIKAGEEVV